MNLAYTITVSGVWFLSTYFAVVLLLTLFIRKSELHTSPPLTNLNKLPKVSILVPVYNEEETVGESIKSLEKVDYPKDKLEIVIINDGSTDNTSEIVKKYTHNKNIIFIDNKKNKGKAACLNQGIINSTGKFIACMDADSDVSPDIIKKTIPYFKDEKMGAVTVTVEVKNPETWLEKIIEIEYIIGLSLALKALSFFNAIHVTPGPFSIYRRSLFSNVGVFDTKNITEDLEIAYRIQKNGYKIANCTSTKVKTIAPNNIKSLYVQRKRWYSGALLTLWKHKNVIFNSKLGAFAFVMPYTYILMILGLFLFVFSTYLGISNLIRSMSFFSLTNFNFISYLALYDFDLLSMSTLTFFGIIAIITTITIAVICLRLVNRKVRNMVPGFIGFIFLFFLYQVFWASSIYSVLLGKKIKWR